MIHELRLRVEGASTCQREVYSVAVADGRRKQRMRPMSFFKGLPPFLCADPHVLSIADLSGPVVADRHEPQTVSDCCKVPPNRGGITPRAGFQ